MSFYGNQIIETNKAFSNIIVAPNAGNISDSVTLTPSTQESNLLLMPKDPWIGIEADTGSNRIYLYHTTTAQRKYNSTSPDQINDIHNTILYNNDYLTNYIIPTGASENATVLNPGDKFATIVPIDETKDMLIDNAGHLINAKIAYYQFASMGTLQYAKDILVQTMYGDSSWYEENRSNLHIDPENIGYVPDLYTKMSSIFESISNNSTEFSIQDLIKLKDDVDILKAQVGNLYYPDENQEHNIAGQTIPPSPLSKALISIRDCELAETDSNDGQYLNTKVIEILKGIKDCDYEGTFRDGSGNLKDQIKMLQVLKNFEELMLLLEAFLGLEYEENISSDTIQYIETDIDEIDFNLNPSLYYIRENSSFNNTHTIYNRNAIYYTRVSKNLIEIAINSNIFEDNKQNLYLKAKNQNYYIKAKNSDWQPDESYYLYTGYSKISCNNILNAVQCYSNGQVTETITEYINKLNSAR